MREELPANEYQQNALRTENKDHESVKLRLDPHVLTFFKEELQTLIRASRNLDKIKKYLFYGKKTEGESKPQEYIDPLAQNMQTQLINDNLLRKLHAILGLCTESGELGTMLLSVLCNGENFDPQYLRSTEEKNPSDMDWAKEFGDIAWYLSLGCDSIPEDLESVLILNTDKLRKRYPNLFEEKRAQTHDGH